MKTTIPLDTIVEFKLTSNHSPLGTETVDKIMKIAQEAYKAEKSTTDKIPDPFPIDKLQTDIEWRWQSDRGSLPKRVESWFYKKCKMKLDSVVSSEIGNVARAVIPKDQTYYMDFTKNFNWAKGDFGDPQSCFYGMNGPGHNPQAMQASGKFYAVRFFKKWEKDRTVDLGLRKYYEDDESYYTGISRSWMADSPKKNSSLKAIFNGYGLTTHQISTIVSEYLEADNKKVYIGDTDLYINGDGYVVGDKEEVRKFGERFNLNFLTYQVPTAAAGGVFDIVMN